MRESGGVRPRRALVVAAHPDDAEFQCAGTIARWVRDGCRAGLVVLTRGEMGSHDLSISQDLLVARRSREQQMAARLVGYSNVVLAKFGDGDLRCGRDTIDFVAAAIRRFRPEVLLTYDPWSHLQTHPDHLGAGQAAFRGAIRAREPRVAIESVSHWAVPHLWFFASHLPDITVDVSSTVDIKVNAILCHRSQYESDFGIEAADNAVVDDFVSRMHEAWQQDGAIVERFRRLSL